jgi:hypothetical protein
MHFVEGLSVRKIAQKLKIHRKTVTSRIEQYNQFKNASGDENRPSGSLLAKYLETGTVYDSTGRIARKLTPQIIEQIDACLAANDKKRLDGRRKQQLRKIDIHEILEAAGFDISYSSVCKYIAGKAVRSKEAFIKQSYEPAGACEFDWGEVTLYINAKKRRYYLAVFTSAYSNYRFAILFERQNSLAFRESHIVFYDHVGGVWRQMTYDNMRVAVAEFVGKSEKRPTEALMQLSRWYLFEWRFCNIAKGNEKGHVERSIEYIRRKTFAFKDHFDSFQEAQQYLKDRVSELNKRVSHGEQKSPYDKLQEEKGYLLPHAGKMECFDGDHSKVDKYSTISLGTNRYSVPDRLTGKMVFVKTYSSHLEIRDEKGVVCEHTRSYDRNQWYINLNHYLITLNRKPGALDGSVALKQAPKWIQLLYNKHFSHDPRSFVELLQYCQTHGISDRQLKDSVAKLTGKYPADDVDAAHILALLGNQPGCDAATLPIQEADAIAAQSMENLAELASMMG